MTPAVHHFPRSLVFEQGGLPIHARRFVHTRSEACHDHDFMELVVVLAGSAMHHSLRGDQRLEARDVIILRPGVWHAYTQCDRFQIVNCCFGAELLQHELGWMLDDPMLGPLLWGRPLRQECRGIYLYRLSKPAMRTARRLLNDLHRATEHDRSRSSAGRLARLILILEHLARHLPAGPASATRPAEQPMPPQARYAVRLLEEQIAHPWQTCELAERLGVDVSYAIRLVKRATGVPPLAYLSRVRAEHAASMLVRTQMAITDIAIQVGWPEPSYFARRFRGFFGLSASEYRRRFAVCPPMPQRGDLPATGNLADVEITRPAG